jgi:predicted nuclease with TOPRIM domain
MSEPVTKACIYEVLKPLQEGLAELRREVGDMRGDLHGLSEHQAALSASYAALVGDRVRQGDQLAELRRRVERIEQRLDLADHES